MPHVRLIASVTLAALVLLLAGCEHDPHTAPTAPPPPTPSLTDTVRIAFVGNSLTSENDLPGMLAVLSRVAGDEVPIETAAVAYDGYALEDHLAQGDAARMIARGGWYAVAMQQGPSTLPESRDNLIEYARQFAVLIRAVGARPAMYGVWPERARLFAFDAGIESYRAAADSIGGLLFPVALVWKTAWQSDPALPLYGPDDFHPSLLGTYAAAVTIYAVVRERSPLGLPFRFKVGLRTVALDSLEARAVQIAAGDVTGAGHAARPISGRGSTAQPPADRSW